jgi:ribosomal protein L21E
MENRPQQREKERGMTSSSIQCEVKEGQRIQLQVPASSNTAPEDHYHGRV